ncbi:hypothetical protein ACEWY4_019367 [Coilia grayii]|uniref:C2H2-type domain-containing protein n=1 Tax=Coilia grayii TaxID=363190 RepID=A0ABD1J9W2_9TELE
MENSSVYMCFPCYQEFPTLEEVLAHQLTCTVDTPTHTPAQVSQSLTEEQSEEQQVVGMAPQGYVGPPDPPTGVGDPVAGGGQEEAEDLSRGGGGGADAPRILYQCGDCEVLFESLRLWQHHRKQGQCQQQQAPPHTPPHTPPTQEQHTLSHTPEVEEQHTLTHTHTQADGEEHTLSHTHTQADGEEHTHTHTHAPEVDEQHGPQEPDEGRDLAGDGRVEATNESQEQACASAGLSAEAPPSTAPPAGQAEGRQRRRGVKKAKPPSSLLCLECGAGFSAIAELVSHRRTQHSLQEALHRCQVCGEGFLNTTLFLYHRKQHPQPHPSHSVQPRSPPGGADSAPLLPLQAQVELLLEEESHGQGLLLLAAAGEGQSLGLAQLAPPPAEDTPTEGEVVYMETEATPGIEQALPTESEIVYMDTETMPTNEQDTPTGAEAVYIEAEATPIGEEATPTEPQAVYTETLIISTNHEASADEHQTTPTDTPATPTDSQSSQLQEGVVVKEEESERERRQGEEEEGDEEAKRKSGEEESVTEEAEGGKGGRFLCLSCGSSFPSQRALQSHVQARHGSKGALKRCEVCGQEFISTTDFLYHRKEHRSAHTASHTSPLPTQHTSHQLAVEGSGAASCTEISVELPEVSPGVRLIRPFALSTADGPASSDASLASEPIPPPPAQLSRDWSRAALPHLCPHCGRSFTRRSLLRAHVSSHTGQKLFRCPLCPKAFSCPSNLLRHSQTHAPPHAPPHPHLRPHRCHICAKDFSLAATLKRHLLAHARPGAFRHRRARGSRTHPLRGAPAGQHEHHAHSPHLHTCPDCPASFKMHTQLQKHRLLHNSHPFSCEVCGEDFKRRKDLDLHSLSHQEPQACPHCSVQFLNQTVLTVHLQRCPGNQASGEGAGEVEVEGGARSGGGGGRGRGQGRGKAGGQLECEMCGHRCLTQEGLELHRLSHTGQTPLRCPLMPCRRRFATSAALGEHVLAHCQGLPGKQRAPSRYRCQHCAKEFAYASTFAVHMRIHTDERPFECTQCGKRFRQLPHLQDHERIHSGLRPFACWVCGKSFSVAARLTEHARVHSGEKPYVCPRCPTAFRSRANLDKHLHFHADDPADPEGGRGEGESAVQTILLVHQAPSPPHQAQEPHLEVQEGGSTLILPADQASGAGVLVPGSPSSSVVILHPTITVPSAGVPNISVVEGQEVPHTIEFIIEETV